MRGTTTRTTIVVLSLSLAVLRPVVEKIRLVPVPVRSSSAMAISVQVYTVALIAAVLCLQWTTTRVLASEFDYTEGPNGPPHWGDLNTTWAKCKTGKIQSPLAITPENMVTDDDLDSKLKIKFTHDAVPSNISHERNALQLTIPGDVTLKIDGVKYTSAQMHFHYPSEHTIANYTFPLEMHVVNLHAVAPGVNKFAVIAYLFVLGEENPFLAQFFDKLPTIGQVYPIAPIKLLQSKSRTYGRYTGSLTVPPCTENVTWTVMLWDFPTVSQKQLDQLKAVLPHANARPTIPSHGRKFYINT